VGTPAMPGNMPAMIIRRISPCNKNVGRALPAVQTFIFHLYFLILNRFVV
jgi:hypothetical protein